MSNLHKKIENLTPEQKDLLLKKLKIKGLRKTGKEKTSKPTSEYKFGKDDNFAYKLSLPPNFLKTEFISLDISDPMPEMIQIEAKAASINFRDIMIAMGIYPQTPEIPSVMGSDFAGVVTKVGKRVTKFKKGDKVMVLSIGSFNKDGSIDPDSHFNRFMNVSEKQAFPMPDMMDFSQAASIPTVFVTGYYSLFETGRLKAGETVLIHTATGGVGMAAIELCRWKGATIFATAGSVEKRQILKDMGIPLVMDSRSTDFAQQIKDYTGGKGVDVVFNTLAGEGMMAGIDVLNYFGRFLQIDKKDIALNHNLPLGKFNKGISFTAIDLGLLLRDYEKINQHLYEVTKLFNERKIKLTNLKVFPYHHLGKALNLMSRSVHTGKLVINYDSL